MTRTRFPRYVFAQGGEPDARFTLANERTFLAWIRTALALIAGGVALELLGLDLNAGSRLGASLVLIGCGVLLPPLAWVGWMRTERALRHNQVLPGSLLGLALGIAATIAGVLTLLAIVCQ